MINGQSMPEASTLTSLLDKLFHADSGQAAFSVFAGAMADIGFHGVMFVHRDDGIFDGITNTTYPQAWIDHYISRNYNRTDPTRRFAMYRQQPFFWKEIHPFLRKKERAIFDEAKEFSMTAGIAVPIFSAGVMVGGVGLATDRRGLEDNRLKAPLGMAANMFYTVQANLCSREKNLKKAPEILSLLTAREIEITRRMADGSSNVEIAGSMNISVSTVEFHVRNIVDKLAAQNRTAAVAKALKMGLI